MFAEREQLFGDVVTAPVGVIFKLAITDVNGALSIVKVTCVLSPATKDMFCKLNCKPLLGC